MDIRNIGKTGNVDRSGDRPKRTEAPRDYVIPSVARDEAKISQKSRETAAAVEGLTERARRDGSERAGVVEAARTKLQNGGLDAPAVLAATAERLLGAKFLGE